MGGDSRRGGVRSLSVELGYDAAASALADAPLELIDGGIGDGKAGGAGART